MLASKTKNWNPDRRQIRPLIETHQAMNGGPIGSFRGCLDKLAERPPPVLSRSSAARMLCTIDGFASFNTLAHGKVHLRLNIGRRKCVLQIEKGILRLLFDWRDTLLIIGILRQCGGRSNNRE